MEQEVHYKIKISSVDAGELESKIKELEEIMEKAQSIMQDLADRDFTINVSPILVKS